MDLFVSTSALSKRWLIGTMYPNPQESVPGVVVRRMTEVSGVMDGKNGTRRAQEKHVHTINNQKRPRDKTGWIPQIPPRAVDTVSFGGWR